MVERFERFLFTISEISRSWHKIAADEMEKYDLKGPHAIYLTTMYRYEEGITAARLSELCGKDKSDVSRMMNIMEKKGLVKKEGVNQNLYRALLKLTDEGKVAAEHVRERASLAVEIAGKDLTEEKREIFYESLETIASNLKELSKEGLPKK
ncbi:MAG: winged helix DNA-binding protein [Agathobacter sp.]|nr:winged helix DNA-binding protein [Agathobacter sp.]MBQ2283624.1 winged helix DNA-binding protein [Agathobacter sp.]